MDFLSIDPSTTAMVLIDLQQGIVSLPVEPRSGTEVVANALRLLERFRSLGSTVVLVRVGFLGEKDRLNLQVDAPAPGRPGQGDLLPEIGPKEGDIVITNSAEGHALTVKLVFPRIGRVRSTDDILKALV
jgi:nicotinamidase-related amidase